MNENFTSEELFELFLDNAKHHFSGWDFSYIEGRMVMEPLTWSYQSRVIPLIRSANSLLDMGTGGGELLYSLQPLPKDTYATEAYKPNVFVAQKKLEPISVKVVEIDEDDEKLPFEDEKFDLIINRHEFYSPKEVFRILKKGGLFVTQQVGGENDLEFNAFLEAPIDIISQPSEWNLKYAAKGLRDVGFTILQEEENSPKTKAFDIGAIVYYFKAIPWQLPDFTIEKYLSKLKEMHYEIEKKGYFETTSQRFFILAKKNRVINSKKHIQ